MDAWSKTEDVVSICSQLTLSGRAGGCWSGTIKFNGGPTGFSFVFTSRLSSDSYRISSSPTTSSGCKSFSYCSSSSIGDLYKREWWKLMTCIGHMKKLYNNKIIGNRCANSSNLAGSTSEYSCRTNARNAEKIRCSRDHLIKLGFM